MCTCHARAFARLPSLVRLPQECASGETCYNVPPPNSCGPQAFCGVDYLDAANNCRNNAHGCPSGDGVECPSTTACFEVNPGDCLADSGATATMTSWTEPAVGVMDPPAAEGEADAICAANYDQALTKCGVDWYRCHSGDVSFLVVSFLAEVGSFDRSTSSPRRAVGPC